MHHSRTWVDLPESPNESTCCSGHLLVPELLVLSKVLQAGGGAEGRKQGRGGGERAGGASNIVATEAGGGHCYKAGMSNACVSQLCGVHQHMHDIWWQQQITTDPPHRKQLTCSSSGLMTRGQRMHSSRTLLRPTVITSGRALCGTTAGQQEAV